MGSLSSTPKIPAQKVIYAPAPTISTAATEQKSEVDNAAESREKTLLARNRGRRGTIATSLHGFLGEIKSDKRKTLLGE